MQLLKVALQLLRRADLGQVAADVGGEVAGEGGEQHPAGSARFDQLLGKPAGEVIRDRLLLEAKRLLVNVDMGIAEIAYKLSFTDHAHFTKFFKKETGETPDEFRKRQMTK